MSQDLKDVVVDWLADRGVQLEDIATIAQQLQQGFHDNLGFAQCLESVTAVVAKREVQHALLTGIALDRAAEEGVLPEPLLTILRADDPLYGVDEVLALAITNVYGSIGLTNFGYLDKTKVGIIGTLNYDLQPGEVHTFLDDMVAGIAAAAAARLAHNIGE